MVVAHISLTSRLPSGRFRPLVARVAGGGVAVSDTNDRLLVEDGGVDVGEEAADSPNSDNSATPHWACAFCMTLVLSSRNINESWSRYPGHCLRTRTHCVHCGRTL